MIIKELRGLLRHSHARFRRQCSLGAQPEVVEMLRAAARAFLADDLRPRPPIDVEAERVEVAAAPESQQAASGGSAAVIPIRG